MTNEEFNNSMYYKDPSGVVWVGSEAFFALLRQKSGLMFIIGRMGQFPLVQWFSLHLYRTVASNRFVISRLLNLKAERVMD